MLRLFIANVAFACWTILLAQWLLLFWKTLSDWFWPRGRLPTPFVVVASPLTKAQVSTTGLMQMDIDMNLETRQSIAPWFVT